MYQQLRGPERLFRVGQWAVAVLFAYFLIHVGASVIADLPLVDRAPVISDFENKTELAQLNKSLELPRQKVTQLDQQLAGVRRDLKVTQEENGKAKESFYIWRAARSSTENSDQNPEVIRRAQALDELLQKQEALRAKLRQVEEEQDAVRKTMAEPQERIRQLKEEAQRAFEKADKAAALKAFFIRLLFVLPVLLIAVWLFRKYRKSSQWPFVWGFVFFALVAFFVELVPYLPSFGGYIRYGVGAILTFVGGRTLIKALQNYLDKKALEQSAPQEERKQDIRYEKALESIDRGQCPSCERTTPPIEGKPVGFCMHCGLKIFTTCTHCEHRHNAFYPFCPVCGHGAQEQMTVPGGASAN